MTKKRLLFRSLALVALMIVCNSGGAWAQDSRIEVNSGTKTLDANKTYQFSPVNTSSEFNGGGIYVATGAKVTGTGITIAKTAVTGDMPTTTDEEKTLSIRGGGLYVDGKYNYLDNPPLTPGYASFSGDTKFSGNSITVTNNVNKAKRYVSARGGAAMSYGHLEFNGNTTFSNNTLTGTMTNTEAQTECSLYGSALGLTSRTASLKFNGDLLVTGNTMSLKATNVKGNQNRIEAKGTFCSCEEREYKFTSELVHKGKTTFSNNKATVNITGATYADSKKLTAVNVGAGAYLKLKFPTC